MADTTNTIIAGRSGAHQTGISNETANPTINVEIYADIICPWCYIGKKRLDAAFAARPHITPNYIWRAYLLNPTMPPEGMDRAAYLGAKFGHSANAVYGRIAAAGLDSGIQFNFDAIEKTSNSRKAHRALLGAGVHSAALSERLYHAYFVDGLDIGDDIVLATIIDDMDIDTSHDIASNKPNAEQIDKQLENDLAMASQLNLDGVPFFVFASKYAIAGAHQPEHLIPAIDAAAAEMHSL